MRSRSAATIIFRAILACSALAFTPSVPAGHTMLYTHSETGPISIKLIDTDEPVKPGEADPEVRRLVDAANALFSGGDQVSDEHIEQVLARGRVLKEKIDAGPADYLFLSEVIRRLEDMRLKRLPVASTRVAAAYAGEYPVRFGKPVLLRPEANDLGISYAGLAACLELADFPSEAGPREVVIESGGAMHTSIAGMPLHLDIVPFRDNRMLMRGVSIGEFSSRDFRHKARVARYLLERCI